MKFICSKKQRFKCIIPIIKVIFIFYLGAPMRSLYLITLFLLPLFFLSCDDSSSPVTVNVNNEASISGKILPAGTLASITVTQGETTVNTTCDANGNFSLSGLLSGSAILTIKATKYGTSTRFISLSGGGHNQLSDITLSKLPNPVNSISPSDNDNNVSLSSNITINFFREMDSASTEGAFSITPAVKGSFHWGSDFKKLTFDPTTTLASGTSYTVTVDTTALEVDSSSIEFSLSYTFNTAGFSLGSISPQNGSSGISLNSSMIIYFSSQYDNTKLLDYITITPDIELKVSQVSGNHTYFKPLNGYWAAGTKYTVTISDSFSNVFGTPLDNQYSSDFTTTKAEVYSISPVDSSEDVSITQYITLNFNTLVNKNSIENALLIVDSSGDTLSGEFSWYNSTSFQFYPENALKTSELYLITLDTSATDVYGKKINSFASQFSTEAFEIENVSPEDKSTGFSTYNSISLRFNASVDKNTFPNRIHVSPSTSLEFSYSGDNVYVKPAGSYWQAGTKYTLTIEDSVMDINGNILGDSIVTTFTTSSSSGSTGAMSVTPKDSSENFSLSRDIYVNYNKEVKTSSAEAAFKFYDYNDSILPGTFSWNSNNTQLTFKPLQLLHPLKLYKIVTGSVIANDGDTLESVTSIFRTTNLWMSYTSPTNGTGNHNLNSSCSFTFNSSFSASTIEDVISISPAIDLKITVSSNTVYIFPRDYNYWASNTKYEVTIDSSLNDIWGGIMGEDYLFEFTTLPILITQTSPTNEATNVDTTSFVYSITFNTDIDSLSATGAINVKEKVSETPVAGTVGISGQTVTFTPAASLTSDMEYEVVVDTSLTDLFSVQNNKVKSFTFKTMP